MKWFCNCFCLAGWTVSYNRFWCNSVEGIVFLVFYVIIYVFHCILRNNIVNSTSVMLAYSAVNSSHILYNFSMHDLPTKVDCFSTFLWLPAIMRFFCSKQYQWQQCTISVLFLQRNSWINSVLEDCSRSAHNLIVRVSQNAHCKAKDLCRINCKCLCVHTTFPSVRPQRRLIEYFLR